MIRYENEIILKEFSTSGHISLWIVQPVSDT